VLQFIVLTAAVLIVVPLAFNRIGGVSTFVSSTPETFLKYLTGNTPLALLLHSEYIMLFFGW